MDPLHSAAVTRLGRLAWRVTPITGLVPLLRAFATDLSNSRGPRSFFPELAVWVMAGRRSFPIGP
jgi:hypothetical protein